MDNGVGLDQTDGCATAEFDITDGGMDSLLTGILDALSTVSGVDPLEMEPLQSHVDTDALERLVTSQATRGGHAGDLTVTLSIDEYEITIQSYGIVHVTERTDGQ